MSDALDLFYWDTCIFYEFLKDEPVEEEMKQAINDLLLENKQKRNRICTSVVTHNEVLPKRLTQEAESAYWEKFNSPVFFDIEADRSVILLSRKIRNYYFKTKEADGEARLMTTGDSIHLATAIIHEAAEFHTRDNKRKGGVVSLLTLNSISPGGKICGEYDLKIVSPRAREPRFEGT